MCCSRVCRASRRASRPSASLDTPTKRPGIWRRWASVVAKKAAWGPPKPRGTPKRWALPTAMSTPSSATGRINTWARGSTQAITSTPAALARAITAAGSGQPPLAPGSCSNNPKLASLNCIASGSPCSSSMPSGSARVWSTARVWGKRSACTWKWRAPLAPLALRARAMASAAAVASSSREALAIGRPVSSVISV